MLIDDSETWEKHRFRFSKPGCGLVVCICMKILHSAEALIRMLILIWLSGLNMMESSGSVCYRILNYTP